jgi:GNAT superfamily N-acetyltransferase
MLHTGFGCRQPDRTMPAAAFQICTVRSVADLAAAIGLFRANAASLDIDLGYQNFEAEMAAMPGKYAPPQGELLIARSSDGDALACVGVRPLVAPDVCEMKRLFVVPDGRGLGLGKAMVLASIAAAEDIGYREIRLDTLPTMGAAQALYRALQSNRSRLITPRQSPTPSSCAVRWRCPRGASLAMLAAAAARARPGGDVG